MLFRFRFFLLTLTWAVFMFGTQALAQQTGGQPTLSNLTKSQGDVKGAVDIIDAGWWAALGLTWVFAIVNLHNFLKNWGKSKEAWMDLVRAGLYAAPVPFIQVFILIMRGKQATMFHFL